MSLCPGFQGTDGHTVDSHLSYLALKLPRNKIFENFCTEIFSLKLPRREAAEILVNSQLSFRNIIHFPSIRSVFLVFWIIYSRSAKIRVFALKLPFALNLPFELIWKSLAGNSHLSYR